MLETRIGRTNKGGVLNIVIAVVAFFAWSKTQSILCNAWVSTTSTLNNAAPAQCSSRSKTSGKFSRGYWVVLNAVVGDPRQVSNRTTACDTATATRSNNNKSKIKRTKKIYVDRWNSMFERLKEYKKKYGNTNVPKKYNDGGTPALGNWVSKQRFEALVYQNTDGEEGQITLDRICKLESIGFVWELGRQDEWEEKWLAMFSELKAFQEKFLSTKVPILDNKDFKATSPEYPMSSLGRWVKTQRIQRNKLLRNEPAPAMTKERLSMLQSIDFAWSGKRVTDYDKWLNMYFKLLFYHQQHNTTIISDSEGQGSSRLLKWTEEQRGFYRDLNVDEKGTIQTNGDNDDDDSDESSNGNTLTQHRIDLLNEINFDWLRCQKERTWDDMFNELVEYKENFNSTLISTSINERLGKWTISQRDKYNSGSMDLGQQQISKLNQIDFDWNATGDVNWNAMMDRLDAYKRKHDTTIVPNHDGGDRPLANWVNNQRVKLGKYVLNEDGEFYDDHDLVERIAVDLGCSPECEFEPKGFIQKLSPSTKATRIRRLNEIGFVWDAQEASWQDMYQRLLVYKEQNNGSTTVPFSSQDKSVNINGSKSGSGEQHFESLGVWVKVQRHKKQHAELSEKRLHLLNRIDFVWDPQEAQWNETFDRLCVYQQEHNGSTNVPRSYPPDPELGFWLNTQRRAYKRKTLPRERIDRMNSIGFVWEMQ